MKAAAQEQRIHQAMNERRIEIPVYIGVGEIAVSKNPDNVLTASKAVPEDLRAKITAAAIASKGAFGAKEMRPFKSMALDFSLDLMKKGQIDPLTYTW